VIVYFTTTCQKVWKMKLGHIFSFFLFFLWLLTPSASAGEGKFDVVVQITRLEKGCSEYRELLPYKYLHALKMQDEYTDYQLFNAVDQLPWVKFQSEESCKAALVTNTIEGVEHYREVMLDGRFRDTATLRRGAARMMDAQLKDFDDPAFLELGESLINEYISLEMNEGDKTKGLNYMRAAYGYIAAAQIVETQHSTDLLRSAVRIAREGFIKAEFKSDVSVPYDIALLALSERIEAGTEEYSQILEQRISALSVRAGTHSSAPDEIAIIHAELGRHALAMELISEISLESDIEVTIMCRGLILDPRLDGLRDAEPSKFARLMSRKCYDIVKTFKSDDCKSFSMFARASSKSPDWLDYFILGECNYPGYIEYESLAE